MVRPFKPSFAHTNPRVDIGIIATTSEEPKQCLVWVAGEREEIDGTEETDEAKGIEGFLPLIRTGGIKILEVRHSGRVTMAFPHSSP